MRGPVPPIRIYIHVLLHRLGVIAVNHFNEPYRGADRVQGFSESRIPVHRQRLCVSQLEWLGYVLMMWLKQPLL